MKKTLFITSALAVLAATPAMAAYVSDTEYAAGSETASGCVSGVLGVTQGTAQTEAQFTINTYACEPGTYLPDGDTWTAAEITANSGVRQCPAGSYCAGSGLTPFTYSTEADQGIETCPGVYEYSVGGSNEITDCYRACVAADSVGATNMIGGVYSNATGDGDGVNTCAPADSSSCAAGYTYVAATQEAKAYCSANEIQIIWTDATGAQFEAGTCTYNDVLTTPDEAPTKRGHTFTGWKFVAQAGN